MKRLAAVLIALMFVFAIGQTQAQQEKKETKKEVKQEKKAERKELRKLGGGYVSQISKDNFYKDFGDLPKVVWVRSNYFDEASFRKSGRNLTGYFDGDGKLVGTTRNMAFRDIPAVCQKNIKKMYKGATVDRAIFFEDNQANDTDMMLYGIQFDDQDVYFVELTQGAKKFVVESDPSGDVQYFKKL